MLIVKMDGQEYKIEGRAARIMLWLLSRLEQINEYDREAHGEIRITYSGKSLKASLKQIDNLE